LFLILVSSPIANAQFKNPKKDSVATASARDSSKTDTAAPKHKHLSEPDKAALKSAIIPGWGQATHHDTWWHVPIIYAGFAVMGYIIWWNDTNYINYRNAARLRFATILDTNNHHYDVYDPRNPYKGVNKILDPNDIVANREYYRRNRDLTIIIASVWYVANILDAYVFTHLREFDISNDLSMRIEPINLSMLGNQPVVTCGLKFNIR